MKRLRRKHWIRSGFSLVELLMAIAITLTLTLMVVRMVDLASNAWRRTSENSKAFQSARVAFETVTRILSQATLAIEYDYYDASLQSRQELAAGPGGAAAVFNFIPHRYGRISGLHFTSGPGLVARQHTQALFFQSLLDFDTTPPVGQLSSGQLNATGFFIRYENDGADRPSNIPANSVPLKERFRLLMYMQPTSELDVYRLAGGNSWFTASVNAAPPRDVRLLAENVVLLVVLPKAPGQSVASLAPGYVYNSRVPWSSGDQPIQMHQLPPTVELVMIAVEEGAFIRNTTLAAQIEAFFSNEELFRLPVDLDADLRAVEQRLRALNAEYRIFRTDVPLRSAKWTP